MLMTYEIKKTQQDTFELFANGNKLGTYPDISSAVSALSEFQANEEFKSKEGLNNE